MSQAMYSDVSKVRAFIVKNLLGLLLTITPAISMGQIVWSGDFNDRNFRNYHSKSNAGAVFFNLVPTYGRPPQYGGQVSGHTGNGDLLDLVSSKTRGSKYAARFTIKNSANGSETADCDPAIDCRTRRSQLQMTSTLLNYYNAMPQGTERWLSISFYLPADFDTSGSGFGPVLWGSKGSGQQGSGWLGISANSDNGWQIHHRFLPTSAQVKSPGTEWWRTITYSTTKPNSSEMYSALADFPDFSASRAALANQNRGGWTDFVFHFRTDVDQAFENCTGFLDLYMRAGSGPWVHVLDINPLKDFAYYSSWPNSKPSRLYDRCVGQYGPGGYTSQMGLYLDKSRVWGHSRNLVIYMDNHKIGDERATFQLMSHDGSSPDNPGSIGQVRPMPPVISSIQ